MNNMTVEINTVVIGLAIASLAFNLLVLILIFLKQINIGGNNTSQISSGIPELLDSDNNQAMIQVNETELVAVITAALAYEMDMPGEQIRIRSINKLPANKMLSNKISSGWGEVALWESMK